MMNFTHYIATLGDGIRISYIDQRPPQDEEGVVVLIHGFPQTSYQFRHVIDPIVSSGYRVVVPDYRGAGSSSKPEFGFTKSRMAADILNLLDNLGIRNPVHVVGHDIGGMIAYSFVSHYPERAASVVWGECPLPGTRIYDDDCTKHSVTQFHFHFHSVLDLPEALVTGREETYLSHFFSKQSYNGSAITQSDLDHYVKMYSRPGALRCAFATYRAFPSDAEENRLWILQHGKCEIRALGLSGAESRHKNTAEEMLAEVHEAGTFRVAEVPYSGHYIAEENPEAFTRIVLDFIRSG